MKLRIRFWIYEVLEIKDIRSNCYKEHWSVRSKSEHEEFERTFILTDDELKKCII
jgi:hypothetical protein